MVDIRKVMLQFHILLHNGVFKCMYKWNTCLVSLVIRTLVPLVLPDNIDIYGTYLTRDYHYRIYQDSVKSRLRPLGSHYRIRLRQSAESHVVYSRNIHRKR